MSDEQKPNFDETIIFGKFKISPFDQENLMWIENEIGEGMTMTEKDFEKMLGDWFRDNF